MADAQGIAGISGVIRRDGRRARRGRESFRYRTKGNVGAVMRHWALIVG